MNEFSAFKELLKEKCDIVQVISSYVDLKKKGSEYVGLCPFHNEKTPSFTVYANADSPHYHCFGCNASGDVISFIENTEHLDFIDAVKFLADRCGLEVPATNYNEKNYANRKSIIELNVEAAKFYHKMLFSPEGKSCLDYLRKRGLDLKTIKKFGLGYAPDSWDSLIKYMKNKNVYPSQLLVADLVKKSNKNGKTHYYDSFRNRLIIPIINVRKQVIAFGSRALSPNDKAKYINTADTPSYKKSNELFALNLSNNKERVLILTEGYFDVMTMHQFGFPYAVACCGTALTKEQVSLMSRYCKELYLCYDNDSAGKKATMRAIELCKNSDLKVRVILLDGGKDPDEAIRKMGKEYFNKLISTAPDAITFLQDEIAKNYNLKLSDDKNEYIEKVINEVYPGLSDIELEIYSSKLAEKTGINKSVILNSARRALKKQYNKKRYNFNNTKQNLNFNSQNSRLKKDSPIKHGKFFLLASMIKAPELFEDGEIDLEENLFENDELFDIFNGIFEMIKKGEKPELLYFSENLDEKQKQILIKLINSDIKPDVNDVIAAVKYLKDELKIQNIENKDFSKLSDEDYLNLFENQED
ncbi:MAG: DNA primase [Clostridia bacterium]|nr:DNA primase [Clostridia bacterium]